jgi:hypothetical protein
MAGRASSIASFTLLETLAPLDEIFSGVVLGSDIKAFSFNRVDEAFTLEVARRGVCGLAHRCASRRAHPFQIAHLYVLNFKGANELNFFMSKINTCCSK